MQTGTQDVPSEYQAALLRYASNRALAQTVRRSCRTSSLENFKRHPNMGQGIFLWVFPLGQDLDQIDPEGPSHLNPSVKHHCMPQTRTYQKKLHHKQRTVRSYMAQQAENIRIPYIYPSLEIMCMTDSQINASNLIQSQELPKSMVLHCDGKCSESLQPLYSVNL